MVGGRIVGAAGLVRWAFADRTAGVSRPPYDRGNLATHVGDDPVAVATNRRSLADHLGATAIVGVQAVHGADVAVIDSVGGATDPGEPAPPADALVCAQPGVALLVLAADCVPVVLADADAGLVAVAHAGWRGVRDDVVGAVVAALRERGGETPTAVVGPAICGGCYGVPADRYEQVVTRAPVAAARTPTGARALDLRAAVLARLAELAVPAEVVGGCTREDPRWFSHRRDGTPGPTGRHGGAVVRLPSVAGGRHTGTQRAAEPTARVP